MLGLEAHSKPSPRLAQELLHGILDHVEDYSTLLACSLTASRLRPYAQERLFTSIRVNAAYNNNLSALCFSLGSTSLARHTRRVEITGPTHHANVESIPLLMDVLRLLSSTGVSKAADAKASNSISHLSVHELEIYSFQLWNVISMFPRLSSLRLAICQVNAEEDEDDGGMPALMSIPRLSSLFFRGTHTPRSLLRALAESEASTALRSIDLNTTNVPPEACQALIQAAGSSLEHCSILPGMFDAAWPVSGT